MTMATQMRLILAAATLSAVGAVCAAQTAGQSGPANSNSMQTEAAPIERAYPGQNNYTGGPSANEPAPNAATHAAAGVPTTTEPIAGVMLRVTPQTSVEQVSNPAEGPDPQKFELRVERGVVNVNIHNPGKDKLILVDLPGGQTQLLKNGLYAFNAETNTARVLKGEALAFPQGAAPEAKPLKVKEYNKVVFNGANVKPHEFVPYEASVDLLPGPEGPAADGVRPGYAYEPYAYGAYAYGPYGDGFYGSPYWAYGYPGYPYGYGFYPYGAGLGFTYYGGFHGYHGGYHGGIHGGGVHGEGYRGR